MRCIAAAAVLLVPLALASCSSDSSGPSGREPGSIEISDADIVMNDGDTVQVSFSLFDEDGEVFAEVPSDVDIFWTTQTPSILTVLSDGRVIALHPGTGTVRVATADGLISQATVQVSAVATEVIVVDGQNQNGLPNTALEDSVVVRVRDRHGNPVPGAQVQFTVTSGGGSVSPALGISDAQGYVRTEWTLGPTVGDHDIEATLLSTSATVGIGATISNVVFVGVNVPATVTQGGTLAGTVRIDADDFVQAIGAGHVVVSWDPTKLQLQGGSLVTGNYSRAVTRFNNTTGELHILGTDPDISKGDRSLAGLTFNVVGGAGTTTTIGVDIESLISENFNAVAAGVASDVVVTIN